MRGPAESRAAPPAWLRPTVEYGPLAVFFLTYLTSGLLPATGALIAATAVALILSVVTTRRVPFMPLVTAAVVGVFGGLTLWLNDETFIKMKPTIIQALFAAVLVGGLPFGWLPLKMMLGTTWPMAEAGWRRLTLRFAGFFAAMAVLNEVVWRTQSTDVWVAFKVFGIIGLTFLFALAQMPLMTRYRQSDPVTSEAGDG